MNVDQSTNVKTEYWFYDPKLEMGAISFKMEVLSYFVLNKIKRNDWGDLDRNGRGENPWSFRDKRERKHFTKFISLIKNESQGIKDD